MFEHISELLKWQSPDIVEIIDNGILPVGSKLVLAGSEGSLKTMFSTYAGLCIASGCNLLCFRTTKTRVLMLQAELPKHMFKHRVEQMQFENKDMLDIFFSNNMDIKLNKPIGVTVLSQQIKHFKPGLLIIDPLYKVISADISNWNEMSNLINNLDYIISLGCSLWIVHHTRKQQITAEGTVNLGTDELIGSSIIKDWADTIIRLDSLGNDILRLNFLKTRNARSIIQPIEMKFDREKLLFYVNI